MKRSNWLNWKWGSVVLSVVLIGSFLFLGKCHNEKTYQDLGVLKKQSIKSSVYGIGTITAQKTFQVKVGVTSRIEGIFVTEGDVVRKGDRLVEFDSGLVATAPFSGTITSIYQKTGELAYPQSTILQVLDLKNRYVQVGLEQQSAAQVKPGMVANLSFEGLRGETLTGIGRSTYPNDGQFLVRIDVAELPTSLLPGMTLDVAVILFEKKDCFVVPTNALQGSTILIRRDVRPISIPIKVGIVDGTKVEIISTELKEGDILVGKR